MGCAGVLTAVLWGGGHQAQSMHDARMYVDVNRKKGVSSGTVTV